MSWTCPHNDQGRCSRRLASCTPGAAGCVLEGQVILMSPQPSQDVFQAGQDDRLSDRRESVIDAMKRVFGTDQRRIDHALRVLAFAETLLVREPGQREVVVAAAILHDIGIHEAERKYGSTAGRYQEIEGPLIAETILRMLSFDAETIDHVCRIIANHHSARDIDTPEFRIIWDADWLVNLPEEYSSLPRDRLAQTVAKVFRTDSGRNLARSLYLEND